MVGDDFYERPSRKERKAAREARRDNHIVSAAKQLNGTLDPPQQQAQDFTGTQSTHGNGTSIKE